MAKSSRPFSSGSTNSNVIGIWGDWRGGAELPLLPTNMHEALILINSLMVEIEEVRHETQRATTGCGTLGAELEKALEHGTELGSKLARSKRELQIERENVQNAVLQKEQATKSYEGAHEALKIAVDRVEQMSKDLANAQNALEEANVKTVTLSQNLSQYQLKVKTAFDENETMAKELQDLRAYQMTSLNAANSRVAELEKQLQDVREVLKGQSKVQQHESEIQKQDKDDLQAKISKMEGELKGANEVAEEQVLYPCLRDGQIDRLPVKHLHLPLPSPCLSVAVDVSVCFLGPLPFILGLIGLSYLSPSLAV
jgi:chromosome segregation ATPase